MAPPVLSKAISQRNFKAFLWHGVFLSLTQNFVDVDTIAPAMLLDAGGNSFHVGLLTAIMLGGSSFLQIVFSPFLNNRQRKKPYLIAGIIIRAAALTGLGLILLFSVNREGNLVLLLIFILISVFSLGGSFAAISYTDILGKSMLEERRKSYFSLRQSLMSLGVLVSAFLAAKLLVVSVYPANYASLYILSGISLTIAMLGFIRLKEIEVPIARIEGFKDYVHILRREIGTNIKLRYYLLLVNTLGISITLLPFVLMYSKEISDTGNADVGKFLVYKVMASVLVGLIIYRFANKLRYQYLLYGIGLLSLFLPAHLMLYGGSFNFAFYFFLGGIIFTLYKVAIEGILLEVSTNENRAVYAGISGAGNILPALFPVFGGLIIQHLSFEAFFIVFMVIVSCSFYLTYRLNCQR